MEKEISPLLRPYLSKDYGSFNLQIYKRNVLAIYNKKYCVGLLAEHLTEHHLALIVLKAELFRMLNSYGILDNILKSDLPFSKMLFVDKESKQIFETTREIFLKHGKVKRWPFGVKRYLHLSYFKEMGTDKDENDSQLSLVFKKN